MEEYLKKYEQWCKSVTDKAVAESLKNMEGDEEAVKDAFYKDLEFGTGGLRGVMSAGTNRMNVYTVKRTSEGLARFLLARGKSDCVVTYDSRLNSKLFAETTAATLASFGIKVYITKECSPTPFLSYLVRYYRCGGGVNITASHNPCEYNGYKVYDESGCQLTDKAAQELTNIIEQTEWFACDAAFSDYMSNGITYVEEEALESYVNCVLRESLNNADGLDVTYTPLNGVGHKIVPYVLSQIGVKNISVVPEQSYPDGRFLTCPYPNPEKEEALSLAVKLAEEQHSDVVIATDPDSDRQGVAVRHGNRYVQLSGNEVGVLLCDYVLSQRLSRCDLPQKPVIVKTIVTTNMIDALAEKYGAETHDVLTGFKYIGDVINKLEAKFEADRFVFGFEESCGYLKGTYARDKDGVVASMLFAECAAYYKKQGKTAVDRLEELYCELGKYFQKTVSYRFEGASGEERKTHLLSELRDNPPSHLGDSKVTDVCDFLNQTEYDLPKANVLRYRTESGGQLIIRPSGTEPLIKCYVTVRNDEETLDKIISQTDKMFK